MKLATWGGSTPTIILIALLYVADARRPVDVAVPRSTQSRVNDSKPSYWHRRAEPFDPTVPAAI
jgi:hypothetical protein